MIKEQTKMKLPTRVSFVIGVVLLVGLSASCQTTEKKNKDYYFNRFKGKYPFLDSYKWTVLYGGTDGGAGSDVRAVTMLGDTTFQVLLRSSFDRDGKEVFSVSLGKIFKKKDTTYYRAFDSELGLRYECKYLSPQWPIFTVGKYQYMSDQDQLTHGQQEYFKRHADSLRLIRGNNLPPLPVDPN